MPEWKDEIRRRLAPARLEPAREAEIVEELAQHLEDRYEEALAAGATAEQARRAALGELSDGEALTQGLRHAGRRAPAEVPPPGAARGGNVIEDLWGDVRYSARVMRKNPGFASVAILTLALGIGANTAIFSVVNAVLLRPLPYANSDQLVAIQDSLPGVGFPEAGMSEMEFLSLRAETQAFERVACYVDETFTLTGGGEPERVSAGFASADFFPLLRTDMAIGRTFGPEEEAEGRNHVAVISHGFWQRRFASNPDAVGQGVALNGQMYVVIGVLPPGFESPLEIQTDARVELWLPPGFDVSSPNRGSHGLNTIGRLRAGATIDQARAETNTIIGRLVDANPTFYPADGSFRVLLTPLHQEIVGDVRPALLVLLCAVGLVLAVACANVTNLLLARSEARHKEVAIRMALGAGRARIVRQLLVESVLLAAIGGGLGCLLAWWGLGLLVSLSPANLPRLQDVGLDRRVFGFTALVSLTVGVLFGLVPALQAARSDLHTALKEGGRTAGSQVGRSRLRDALVVSEIALSLLLLVGAGLLARSVWHLQQVDTGFDAERLLTLRIHPSASAYPDDRQVTAFYERLVERVASLPGVRSAATASTLPISGSNADTMMEIEGRPFELSGLNLSTDFRVVSPDYFRALGVRLVRGRFLTAEDREDALRAVVVNETLARTHWPGEDPVGKRTRLLDSPPDEATTPFMTIVGVVADAKNRGLGVETRQEMYVPLRQQASSLGRIGLMRRMNIVARTNVDPVSVANTIREEVWALDRSIPVTDVRTMEQMLEAAVGQPRFNMMLLLIFAAIALGLGAVGIYGLISYFVTQRTHEFGVRMALGAQAGDVLRLVIGQGMMLVFAGVAVGLVASFAMTRLMGSLLFGVSALDPITFAGVALLLVGVALLACYIPARRATKLDPLIALRCE